MKKKLVSVILCAAMIGTMLAGCQVSTSKKDSGDGKKTEDSKEEAPDDGVAVLKDADMKDREEITMWFWGA